MMTLTRDAYVQMIEEDLVWLRKQPRTLERDHIEIIIKWSLAVLYDGEQGDAFGAKTIRAMLECETCQFKVPVRMPEPSFLEMLEALKRFHKLKVTYDACERPEQQPD